MRHIALALGLIADSFSRASRVDNNICEYWDKGKPGIEAFLVEHLKACSGNWVCNGLQLLGALVQPPSPEEHIVKKSRLEYILEPKQKA